MVTRQRNCCLLPVPQCRKPPRVSHLIHQNPWALLESALHHPPVMSPVLGGAPGQGHLMLRSRVRISAGLPRTHPAVQTSVLLALTRQGP